MRRFQAAAESKLGLPAGSYVYNIVPTVAQADIRSYDYPAITASDHIVAISSDDSIRTLDASTLKTVSAISKAHESITSIKRYAASGAQCTTFMTTGRDGAVRGWDLRSNSKALEFATPKGEPLSALECNSELQAVVTGTELEKDPPGDSSIFGWDVRQPGSTVKMHYAESHNDTITELRFLPAIGETNTLLLSAGTDGMVNIFNTATAEEDDALFQVIREKSALQHAGLIDRDIFTLGTDETLSFHAFQNPDLDVKDPEPCRLGDVREQFSCDYVVNLYSAGTKPYLAVGSYSEAWLDLIRFKNKTLGATEARQWKAKKTEDTKIRLEGAHGEELVRDVLIPEGAAVVYTCGEDGMVRAWTAEGADGDVEMEGVASTQSKKRKGKR